MYFTQEDYRKIQEWLRRNSVKDSELPIADSYFNGLEILTLVQNGQNKRIYLKDLVDHIFSLGVSDFLNVSEYANSYNITLEEAITLIPHKARKRGQVITFNSDINTWETYQFVGALNQWNVLDTWKKIK